VADKEAHIDRVEHVRRGKEPVDLLRRETHARHAGVELQHGGQLAATRPGLRRPQLDLVERIEYGYRAQCRTFRLVAGKQAVEHEYVRFAPDMGNKGGRFAEQGDAEVAAAFVDEASRDQRRAQAIAVSLDHARDLRGAHLLPDQAIIRRQRAQIDGQCAPAVTKPPAPCPVLKVYRRSFQTSCQRGAYIVIFYLVIA
jgi:hypothetical protein